MKIISWNVNGIKAVMKKGFIDFIKKQNPDVLFLQEIKAGEKDFSNLKKSLDYNFYINEAEKKGYAGTAVFYKLKPLKITSGIGNKKYDKEGRVITLEFPNFFLINVYVPNSGRGLSRLDYRKNWDKAFLTYLKKLKKKKPLIVGGDFNVAHEEIDLARPKQNYNKTAGYTQVEIDGFEKILKIGLVDTFRKLNKNKIAYTYWSYRFNARAKNIGWRLDYFLVSEEIMEKIKDSLIFSEIKGSDHCPICILFNNLNN